MGSYFVIKAEVKQGNKNSSCTLYHVERYNEKIHGVRDVTNCNGTGFQFMINSPIPISVEVVMCLIHDCCYKNNPSNNTNSHYYINTTNIQFIDGGR